MEGIYVKIFEEGVTEANIAISCTYAKVKLQHKIEANTRRASITLEANAKLRIMNKGFFHMVDRMSEMAKAFEKCAYPIGLYAESIGKLEVIPVIAP